VVDSEGNVYFIGSRQGVMLIDTSGKLLVFHRDSGGHWLALDQGGAFSDVRPGLFERITPDGTKPALIFASGGAPIAIGEDGELYYGSSGSREESFPAGAMTVARLSARGERSLFSPSLKEKLASLGDGITGIASGPGGSIYVATWKGIVKLNRDGSIARVLHPLPVDDCDHDPADHNPANASSPLLRGLAVDPDGNVLVAATSCHRVLKISPAGRVSTFASVERPWSPTGVALHGSDVYILEYTNANGPATEGWSARVRKRSGEGAWTTLAEVPSVNPSRTAARTPR
jgi:hypothetical protein